MTVIVSETGPFDGFHLVLLLFILWHILLVYPASLDFFQGLTSAEVALVVICVLIFVIFVVLVAFLYCTGRLVCGGKGKGNNRVVIVLLQIEL